MPMRLTLDLPELPRWATDSGTKVEPGESDKDTGNIVGTRPPARWHNWLQNINYEWAKTITSSIVGTMRINPQITASADLVACIGLPFGDTSAIDAGHYSTVMLGVFEDQAYYTLDGGRNWTSAAVPASNISSPRCIAVDSNRKFIIGGSDNFLYYNDDLTSSWALDNGAGTESEIPTSIETKYPDSPFVIVGLITGIIEIAAAGVSNPGTYVNPSTVPPYAEIVLVDRQIVRFLRTGSTAWMLVTIKGEVFTSANDGDDWAAATRITSSHDISHASYSEDSGRVVAIGENASSAPIIYYSDDLGATWTAATIPTIGGIDSGQASYYCGADSWLASFASTTAGTGFLLGSKDNGETWYNISMDRAGDAGGFQDIACNGKEIVVVSDGGYTHTSNAVIGG